MERNRLREARVRRAPASHFEKVIRRDWSRLALVTLSPPERDRSARGRADVPLRSPIIHSLQWQDACAGRSRYNAGFAEVGADMAQTNRPPLLAANMLSLAVPAHPALPSPADRQTQG